MKKLVLCLVLVLLAGVAVAEEPPSFETSADAETVETVQAEVPQIAESDQDAAEKVCEADAVRADSLEGDATQLRLELLSNPIEDLEASAFAGCNPVCPIQCFCFDNYCICD